MFEKPYKTIVVGVDFSPYSKVVVKQAKLLCHIWDSRLVLVHAATDFAEFAATIPYYMLPETFNINEYTKRIKSFYQINNKSTQIFVNRGSPSDLLLQIAKRFSRSLIMVGYKGHNRIAEFLFGSTAQSLALKSRCPVWIHRGNKAITPQKVLVPHDLSKKSNHSIDVVKKLSLASPTTYEVLFVNQTPFPVLDYNLYQKVLRKNLKKTRTEIHKLLNKYPHVPFISTNGEVTEKIVKRSKKFDLLVMSHHNTSAFKSRSETIKVMKNSKVPMIVVH